MIELFAAALSAPNFVPTTLLGLVIVYWLTVVLGAMDMDFMDFDIDMETDVDVDADFDADATAEGGVSWLNKVLVFFNLGQVPFMVWLSFVALPLWLVTIVLNDLIGNTSFILGLLIMLPGLFLSLFIAKFATWPFVKVFAALDNHSKPIEVVGKVCNLVMPTTGGSVAQAEVEHEGAFLTIYVVSAPGIQIAAGETALVVEHNPHDNNYLVEPYTNP